MVGEKMVPSGPAKSIWSGSNGSTMGTASALRNWRPCLVRRKGQKIPDQVFQVICLQCSLDTEAADLSLFGEQCVLLTNRWLEL